ncbi:MAG: hypothetical protein IPK72_13260 [Candidatus Eisenbacteria bacterium]|nr:hypothetical protein [Candidatus Eisenbacteria bacterium]
MQGAEQDASFAHSDQPSLPLVVKWVLLPRETAIESVDAVVVGETRLDGEYTPLPVPRPDQEGSDGDRDVPDLPPWDPRRTYPELRVRVVNEGMMRGYRLATIAIWPLSYEASARSLSIAQMMQVSIRLRPRPEAERAEDIVCKRPGTNDGPYGEIRAALASTVVNPDFLDRFYPSVRSEEQVEPDTDRDGQHATRSAGGNFITEWPSSSQGQAVDVVIITNNKDDAGGSDLDLVSACNFYVRELRKDNLTASVHTADEISSQYLLSTGQRASRPFSNTRSRNGAPPM